MWLTVLSITQLATVAFPASDRNAYLAPVRMIVFIVAGHISRCFSGGLANFLAVIPSAVVGFEQSP